MRFDSTGIEDGLPLLEDVHALRQSLRSALTSLLSRPVLDQTIREGTLIRFRHDPFADLRSYLAREARYLESFGYGVVSDGNGEWVASR